MYVSRFLRLAQPAMQGPDVLAINQALGSLGYLHDDIDDIFHKETMQALREWQETVGINADGVVGPESWCRISQQCGMPYEKLGSFAQRYPLISIDLQSRRLYFFNSPDKYRTFPVAIGKKSTPSPSGNWTIVQKTLNPGGPFGARWMRLSVPWGGYGIHGTNNPRSIGRLASHGCIRMYNKDVIAIYDKVPLGTPVYIMGPTLTGRLLQQGARGEDVARVQRRLRRLGYYRYKIDGVFGVKMTEAVKRFQTNHNLSADGIVGPNTYIALQKALDIRSNELDP
ncbi:MAG: L,D-transpeptidase family protein [Syntrophomonadaceae bacterium]|jgi:L,D-transpeptidase ErfK/SrfK